MSEEEGFVWNSLACSHWIELTLCWPERSCCPACLALKLSTIVLGVDSHHCGPCSMWPHRPDLCPFLLLSSIHMGVIPKPQYSGWYWWSLVECTLLGRESLHYTLLEVSLDIGYNYCGPGSPWSSPYSHICSFQPSALISVCGGEGQGQGLRCPYCVQGWASGSSQTDRENIFLSALIFRWRS